MKKSIHRLAEGKSIDIIEHIGQNRNVDFLNVSINQILGQKKTKSAGKFYTKRVIKGGGDFTSNRPRNMFSVKNTLISSVIFNIVNIIK